eukprot:GFKZ01003686.1.p1 GENE.GFKZ01003686.1~~GFKZ01003686.1.p1  ORF type:complete len:169 (-),score=22.83 GFKZ01003686.1:1467-1973(-)
MAVSTGSAAPEFTACNSADFSLVTDAMFSGKTVVLAFFPAAFSGSPEQGCEMQLCGLNSLVKGAPANTLFYGVSGDMPFASEAFSKKLELDYPLLSDPTLATCKRYVGVCEFGAFLKEVGVSDALPGVVSCNRGCVVVKDGTVVYSFSGDGHPGKMPPLGDIRTAIGM